MPTPPAYFHQDERPAGVPIWRETLAGLDWLSLRASPIFYGWGVKRGDGAPVVVVPGFLGSDLYLLELRCWLGRIGYLEGPQVGFIPDQEWILHGSLLAGR